MPHSFNKIWIHAIWATKERLPLIHLTVEGKIHQFINEQDPAVPRGQRAGLRNVFVLTEPNRALMNRCSSS